MKLNLKLTTLIVALMAFASLQLTAKEGKDSEKHAKISKAEAEKTALSQVKDGKIVDTELEEEHGTLIYEVELKTPGSDDRTEVKIDANTGKVLSVEKESDKHDDDDEHEGKK